MQEIMHNKKHIKTLGTTAFAVISRVSLKVE